MKKLFLLCSFLGCCFVSYSQKDICVDAGSGSSGNGSVSNPYNNIQAAVNAASNGDIIKVAKGTYAGGLMIDQKKVQLLGGFAGGGNFSTANPQSNVTIISGTSAAPCITVNIDNQNIAGTLIISGFTIRNGQRGIRLMGGWSPNMNNITIENNIIENNGTFDLDENGVQYGGGISLEGSNVKIQNNIIRNNKSGRGGAIGATNVPFDFLIADNLIENNTCCDDHGGGMIIRGTGTITRNIFDGNIAATCLNYGYGGGICLTNYDTTRLITLSYNVWRNNYAPLNGGAVFVDEGAKVRMEHELLYNNKSKETGSAVFVDEDYNHNPSVLYMDNCTVAGNTTELSGGAALYVVKSKANVQNSIFWNNGRDFSFEGGTASSILAVNYTLTQQGYVGTGNITSDPLFVNAANGDFHIRSTAGRYDPVTGQFVNDSANSPAIDAGNPSSDFSNEPSPNGGRVNMGRYGNTAEASKSGTTGNEAITQLTWTMFPNPANENVTIACLPSGSKVDIIDLTGKNVYSTTIHNEQTTIRTANFENGVYIVQVTDNGAVSSRKLFVRN